MSAVAVVTQVTTDSARADTSACSNPVLASNLNGWGTLDNSWVTRDPVGDLAGASWAFDTGGREFYMPQVAVSPGQTWTFSARDRVVFGSGTAKIEVDWYTSSGRYLSSNDGSAVSLPQSTTSGGVWTLVSATFTAPATAATAHVLQSGNFGSATGTNFKATMCDYRIGSSPPSTPSNSATPSPSPSASQEAAARYGWGTPNASQSDEYNGTAVDLTKWGLFGAAAGERTGCSPGFNGHGQRCASQTTEGGGYLSVSGTAGGVTGGLYSAKKAFRYGRVEIRERAVALPGSGAAWHAVPLMWPDDDTNWKNAEIDFAERDVADPQVDLFVHHDGSQDSCSKTVDSQQFHNYAIDWQPNSVAWYVDGSLVCTVTASIPYYSNSNGGAQLDMFPDSGPMRPARQDVDWVRMYPNAFTTYN